MFNVAADAGVLLAEAFRLRNQPIHHRAIEIIRSGRIGEVIACAQRDDVGRAAGGPRSARELAVQQGRRRRRDLRHRLLLHQSASLGAGRRAGDRLRVRPGADRRRRARGAIATFAGGRTAEWCVSWQAGPRTCRGDRHEGSLRIENAWGDGPARRRTLEIFDASAIATSSRFAPTDQFWLQLQHMQDCLDNGTPHRIPPANSIAQMRVIDAVYASLKTGASARVGRA